MKTSTWATLLVMIASQGCHSPVATFPGTQSLSTDPSGRFAIQWAEATDNHSHELFLTTIESTNRILVCTFERSVDLLWSPHGDQLAITDWGGSNFADVWIINPLKPNGRTNARDLVPQEIREKMDAYGHLYYSAQKWRSDSKLDLNIEGYDPLHDGPKKVNEALTLDLDTHAAAQ